MMLLLQGSLEEPSGQNLAIASPRLYYDLRIKGVNNGWNMFVSDERKVYESDIAILKLDLNWNMGELILDSLKKKELVRKISGGILIAYSGFALSNILSGLLMAFIGAIISFFLMGVFSGTGGWGPVFYLGSYGMLVGSVVLGIFMIILLIIMILLLIAGVYVLQGRCRYYSFAIISFNLCMSVTSILLFLRMTAGESVGSIIKNMIPLLIPLSLFGFCVFSVVYGWNTFISNREWKEMKLERKKIREETREREKRRREMERQKKHYYEDHWIEPVIQMDNYEEESNRTVDDYYLEKWGRSYYDY
jgi:hypothetical protein